MVKEIFILLMSFGLIIPTLADCPDFTFRCPTGEGFTIGTCWSWRHFNCQTCRSIITEVAYFNEDQKHYFMKIKCRKYSCGGSTSNWYGRNDGCSAGPVAAQMTDVFRAACAIHDICYATPKRTKDQCDNDFLKNMIETCRIPGIGILAYPVCAAIAGIAYRVVKDHGHNFPGFARFCREV